MYIFTFSHFGSYIQCDCVLLLQCSMQQLAFRRKYHSSVTPSYCSSSSTNCSPQSTTHPSSMLGSNGTQDLACIHDRTTQQAYIQYAMRWMVPGSTLIYTYDAVQGQSATPRQMLAFEPAVMPMAGAVAVLLHKSNPLHSCLPVVPVCICMCWGAMHSSLTYTRVQRRCCCRRCRCTCMRTKASNKAVACCHSSAAILLVRAVQHQLQGSYCLADLTMCSSPHYAALCTAVSGAKQTSDSVQQPDSQHARLPPWTWRPDYC
jgi:hypothetical protein